MSHESGGGGERVPILSDLMDKSEPVISFLANLVTAFINTILGTDKSHH